MTRTVHDTVATLRTQLQSVQAFLLRDRGRSALLGLLAVSALVALTRLLREADWDSQGLLLWGLGITMLGFEIRAQYRETTPVSPKTKIFLRAGAFLLLAISGGGFLWKSQLPGALAIFGVLCSAICYYAPNGRSSIKMGIILAIFLLLLPLQKALFLFLAMPFSQISALVSTFLLRLCGVAATVQGAIISIGKDQVAVTAACSGVDLLEAMLLLAYLILAGRNIPMWHKLMQLLALLPIILFWNTLRLFLAILLSLKIGESAFVGTPHLLLGWGAVLGTLVVFYPISRLHLWQSPGDHETSAHQGGK